MPNWQEALAAIEGIKRLLRFDAGFAQWFDRSPAGAKRSFGLMLPMVLVFLLDLYFGPTLRPDLGSLRIVGAAAITYVLGWIMFPLLLIVIGRAIEREGQAIGAITFYNWFGVIRGLLLTLLQIAAAGGLAPEALDTLASVIFFVSLAYQVFAFRVLIGIGYGGAVLLTLLDFILGMSLIVLMLVPLYQPALV